ncbi:MAG: peptidoglycan DD-metalloendopeptidase family protein [Bacilli bacterium]|nr:peptidoglycan DD-metalloendopeptidase family protein [Bacilli bacterium]
MNSKVKILLTLLIFGFVLLPANTHAVTLKEYEDAVAKYTKELKEKEAKIAKSEEEIAQVKKNIANAESKIAATQKEIQTLQEEIEISNQNIAKKSAESKKVMSYYQIENGENAYLEYAFGAESITDMIYRMSIVEQLTEYNDKVMKELRKLVEENTRKKNELSKKEEELKALKKQLESEKERIQAEIKGIEGTIPDTKGQIALYQKRVDYYKSKGCKSNDVIGVTCDVPKKVTPTGKVSPGALIGANGFRYPVDGGWISWAYGSGGHKGVDIVRGCGTPIYAVAPGRVYYTGNTLDVYHAYMVILVHNVNGRLVFSQYAHVQSNIPVSVGQDVDTNTILAYMGSTGYSTGCHLHLEMAHDYGWGYNTDYYTYIRHIINPFIYVPRP